MSIEIYDNIILDSIELAKYKENYVISKDEILSDAIAEIEDTLSQDELVDYYEYYLEKLCDFSEISNIIFHDFFLERKLKLVDTGEVIRSCDRLLDLISRKDLDAYESYERQYYKLERFVPFSARYYNPYGSYDSFSAPSRLIALKSKVHNKYLDVKLSVLILNNNIPKAINEAGKDFNKQVSLAVKYEEYEWALDIIDRELKRAYTLKDKNYVIYVISKKARLLYDLDRIDEAVEFYNAQKFSPNILNFEKIVMLARKGRIDEAEHYYDKLNKAQPRLFVNMLIYYLEVPPKEDLF